MRGVFGQPHHVPFAPLQPATSPTPPSQLEILLVSLRTPKAANQTRVIRPDNPTHRLSQRLPSLLSLKFHPCHAQSLSCSMSSDAPSTAPV